MRENFQMVLEQISVATTEPLKNHPVARVIARDWRDSVASTIYDVGYKVEGSPGKGVWAHTVWLCIFDRLVTEPAQRGFYLVYLVPATGGSAFLSLNQATEEVYNEVGGSHYREALERTAARDLKLLAGETSGLGAGRIPLGAKSRLTRGYESGNIAAIEYQLPLPDEGQLEEDLTRMLLLYAVLVEGRDQVQQDEGSQASPGAGLPEIEARRYRWHKRAERSRSLASAAKKVHGTRCQVEACNKRLSDIYGELGADYIEAHHLTPFSSLEGRPTELDPLRDFAVVCPDCHRMIHRRPEPYSLAEISALMSSLS
jgi:5-methylcytosine-specific restriction protein A